MSASPWLPPLLSPEVLGWAAAGLTLLTFVCRDMRRLRLLALAANAAFIAYGATTHLLPVLTLHLALVPVNLWRLSQALRPEPQAGRAGTPEAARARAAANDPCWAASPANGPRNGDETARPYRLPRPPQTPRRTR